MVGESEEAHGSLDLVHAHTVEEGGWATVISIPRGIAITSIQLMVVRGQQSCGLDRAHDQSGCFPWWSRRTLGLGVPDGKSA